MDGPWKGQTRNVALTWRDGVGLGLPPVVFVMGEGWCQVSDRYQLQPGTSEYRVQAK